MTDIEKTIKEYEKMGFKYHKIFEDYLKEHAYLFNDDMTFADYIDDDIPVFFEGKEGVGVLSVTEEGVQTEYYFQDYAYLTTDQLCMIAHHVDAILRIKKIDSNKK